MGWGRWGGYDLHVRNMILDKGLDLDLDLDLDYFIAALQMTKM